MIISLGLFQRKQVARPFVETVRKCCYTPDSSSAGNFEPPAVKHRTETYAAEQNFGKTGSTKGANAEIGHLVAGG